MMELSDGEKMIWAAYFSMIVIEAKEYVLRASMNSGPHSPAELSEVLDHVKQLVVDAARDASDAVVELRRMESKICLEHPGHVKDCVMQMIHG